MTFSQSSNRKGRISQDNLSSDSLEEHLLGYLEFEVRFNNATTVYFIACM